MQKMTKAALAASSFWPEFGAWPSGVPGIPSRQQRAEIRTSRDTDATARSDPERKTAGSYGHRRNYGESWRKQKIDLSRARIEFGQFFKSTNNIPNVLGHDGTLQLHFPHTTSPLRY